ncbi:hypothetical protein GNI_142820 [Gregarina niphandrodes]|uniref:Uncharacterized protein n=1 Tax=Gregarina niphandrodes TaxID=110365 RepID=A0A023B045_GRENI|nr:hypothetical protein GNI_142820 [Gregarina niphandrodes]EZG44866.1 hypothetical protein GNI_142820 [Gregarina niphandrodes]|eukprot:XP_011132634.1 hypothetical protein GNI_142820 [Gregarina niphandrodes]
MMTTSEIHVDGSVVEEVDLNKGDQDTAPLHERTGSNEVKNLDKKEVQVGLFKGFVLSHTTRHNEFATSLSNKTVFSMLQSEELHKWRRDADGNSWLLLGHRGAVVGIPKLEVSWEVGGDVGVLVVDARRECLLFFDYFWL